MHSPERRGAHSGAHTPGRMANWDLVRIFLEVARIGSFRAAAAQLNMSANFLSKRISVLESAYKTTLMTRHVDGIRLTPEGRKVLEAAKRMEEASFDLDRTLNEATPALSGEVRIAVTEGLGTFWLAPRLVEFQRVYPGLLVDLKCEMRSADVLRLEADVAVQLEEPGQSRPEAGQDRPASHHAVRQPVLCRDLRHAEGRGRHPAKSSHGDSGCRADPRQGDVRQVCRRASSSALSRCATTSRTAHLWSIAKGAGIGWLPTYMPALGDPLIPLDIGVKFELDIWLAYHPDAKRIQRVRQLIDWIVAVVRRPQISLVPRRVRPSERFAESLQGRRAAG